MKKAARLFLSLALAVAILVTGNASAFAAENAPALSVPVKAICKELSA